MTQTQTQAQVNDLFDFAVMHPGGFTYAEAMAALGLVHRSDFFRIVAGVRKELAGDSQVTLICDPQPGTGSPWLYRLVGTLDEASAWASNRVKDAETRLGTILDVAQVIVHATDGRSPEGRKARKMVNAIGYLKGELADIDIDA